MPSVSEKQARTMRAAAHSPEFAKKVGIPVKVAKEFVAADKGKTFKKGGETMDKKDLAQDKKIVKKAVGLHDKQMHGGKKTNLSSLKKGGMTFGGKETKAEEARERKAAPSKAAYKKAEMKFEGEAMKRGGACKKMAGGGLSSGHKSADGIATKGKTKAKQVTMKRGGKS